MSDAPIAFDDGAGYERMMGGWSRVAGDVFLDWLALPPALRWLDVGCGNGAFTERIVARAAPASVDGIDPSEGQLAYARAQPAGAPVRYRLGDAMALPYASQSFDVALMALVIFFVPDPAAGVAEMVRVVRPGGTVATYIWDMHGGGFPYATLATVLREMGAPPPKPQSVAVSKLDALGALWREAGLEDVETREIVVERRFPSFDDVWEATLSTVSLRDAREAQADDRIAEIRERLRMRIAIAADGSITQRARANAVRGRRPA
ncbi:MAG TPA: class I SAM-dependent methyltransferase [Casimicrobiaceae bacterium]|nr:class I SAM-dependent methyltransferase [Casimicrobiaceae bacterium]